MEKLTVFKFDSVDELALINIYPPTSYDGPDTWANEICSQFSSLYQSDYDGTTDGNPHGINVLVPRENLDAWLSAAEEIGAYAEESELEIKLGIYGDSNETCRLVGCEDEPEIYWIPGHFTAPDTQTFAAELGRKGGSVKSEKKTAAARENAKKAGRPTKAQTMLRRFDWDAIVNLMDDDLRERVHHELAPCSNEAFLDRYLQMHKAVYREDFTVN